MNSKEILIFKNLYIKPWSFLIILICTLNCIKKKKNCTLNEPLLIKNNSKSDKLLLKQISIYNL